MKKVLLATTNKDKYTVVKGLFEKTIFPVDDYEIDSLASIEIVLEDKKEEGNNIERAKRKALDAYDALKDYGFDYIVGLDDAIRIKGILDPNIKSYIHKILYEDYLSDGEEYSFSRAYVIIDNNGNTYETIAEIPYKFKNNKNAVVKEFTYPLSQVAYTIDTDNLISSLSDDEALDYYLKYVKDDLMKLNIK